jgi:antitoxin HigA-1
MARVRTHPGEVLREEYLEPLGLSAHQLAEAIDVPPNRISEIAREARSVTADTALRLAKHFDTTPEFWMNLQVAHDLSKAAAEAPAYLYVPVRDDDRRAGAIKTHGEPHKPATGKWVTRETAKVAAKVMRLPREVAASDLSQRNKVQPKMSSKESRQPPKHKK